MFKILIFSFLTGMAFSAHAASSDYKQCTAALEKYFLADDSESKIVCSQNSTPKFTQCMIHRGLNSNMQVLEAAVKCSSKKLNIPIQTNDPNYINPKSCTSRLQVGAKLHEQRSQQICNWDSSVVMQNCIIDLVQQAYFHNEHAIQYCAMASHDYRNKVQNFVTCVINKTNPNYYPRSYKEYEKYVYDRAAQCDFQITRGSMPKPHPKPNPNPRPEPKKQPEPKYEPNYPPVEAEKKPTPRHSGDAKPGTTPEVTPEVIPEAPVPSVEPTEQKSTDRKIPTPVDIRIEGSANPEVNDQPINTGSTDNSEALPE